MAVSALVPGRTAHDMPGILFRLARTAAPGRSGHPVRGRAVLVSPVRVFGATGASNGFRESHQLRHFRLGRADARHFDATGQA